MFKFSTSRPRLVIINLAKKGWEMPNGASLHVEFQIDNAPGRVYNAEAVDNDMVGFSISHDDIDPVTGEPAIQLLFNLLTNGQTLTAMFPDGDEQPWQASLDGSAVELNQFSTCIETVRTATNQTQPLFSGGNPAEGQIPYEQDEIIRKVIEPYLKMIQ